MKIGVTLAVIGLLYQIGMEMGPWASFAAAVLFIYINYLDNQVKLLRHELKLAKHDGEIDVEPCNASH